MSDHWSDCGMIFYCDGEGYALDCEGNTVCLCYEDSVNKVLSGVMPVSSLKNDKQRECIEIILEYRRVKGYGKQDESFKPRGYIGSRPVRVIKHKQGDVKRFEVKKRVSLGKFKSQ